MKALLVIFVSLGIVACASKSTTQQKVLPSDSDAQQLLAVAEPPSLEKKEFTEADRQVFEQALLHIDKKEWSQATSLFKSIEFHEQKAEVLTNLAYVSFANTELETAIDYAERAIRLGDPSAEVLQLRAEMFIKEGKFSSAKTLLTQSLSVSPNSADAYYNLGVLNELYLRDFGAAVKAYNQYLALKPNAEDAKLVSRWIKLLERKL